MYCTLQELKGKEDDHIYRGQSSYTKYVEVKDSAQVSRSDRFYTIDVIVCYTHEISAICLVHVLTHLYMYIGQCSQ